MPTVRTVLTDRSELERHLVPRDDLLVRERAVSATTFVAEDGPFVRWERSVVDDGDSVVETVDYRLGAPHWGWLVDQLVRRAARLGVAPERRPAWLPSDRLGQRDATILGLCATLALIAGLLGGLIGQTMTFAAVELFGEAAADSGATTGPQARALAVIRIGAVLTFLATALADRRGRRPLLRACLLGSGLASLVTMLAPNFDTVTGSQLVSRGLVAGAAYLVPIMCAEELPARSRAYAIGLMALPGGLGVGIVLWFVPFLDLADWAWRGVYLLAVPAMIMTVLTVRRLPESRRFDHDDHIVDERSHQHVQWSRLAILAVGMFCLNLFVAPTQQLQTDYLRNTQHMSSGLIAVFMLATNTWGFLGIFAGARLADRSSRRLAATVGLLGLALGNTVLFSTTGWPMWLGSLVGSLVGAAVIPSLGAILPELFPTLRRGAANGLLNGAAIVGSIVGLEIVVSRVSGGQFGSTVVALAAGPLIVAGLVWFLPETAGVELEALNPDD